MSIRDDSSYIWDGQSRRAISVCDAAAERGGGEVGERDCKSERKRNVKREERERTRTQTLYFHGYC